MAMAYKVRSLVAELGFKINNLKAAQDFEDAVENIRAGMQGISSVAKKAALGVGAMVGGLTAFQASTAANAAELRHMAQGVGLNTDRLQQLAFAYGQLKVDQAELIDSYQKLSDRVEKAAKGSKEYARALALAGQSAQTLAQMPLDQAYDQVLAGVMALESPQKRLAALTGIFGETLARKLAPALAENGKLLKEYTSIAEASGVVMSEDQLAAMDELDKSFRRVKATLQGLKNQLAVALAPVFQDITRRVTEWFQANRELVQQRIENVAERIGTSIGSLAASFAQLNAAVEATGGWFALLQKLVVAAGIVGLGQLTKSVVFLVGGLKTLAGAIIGITGLKLAVFFGVVAAAVGALGLALEETFAALRGGETLLDHLLAQITKLHPVLQIATVVWQQARLAIVAVGAAVLHLLLPGLLKLRPVLKVLAMGILLIVATVVLWATMTVVLVGVVVYAIGTIVENVTNAFSFLLNGLKTFAAAMSVLFDPTEEAVANLQEKVRDLIKSLAKLPIAGRVMKWGLEQAGVDPQVLDDKPDAAESWLSSLTSRVAGGPLVSRAMGSQNVVIEQQNTFNVSGSMDEKTGRKIASDARSASQDAANSINNAARGGIR